MSTKSFILSSSGLRNIIQRESNFTFIFGERSIQMTNVIAEFLSPTVSHLHLSDPTIDSIQFECPSENNLPSFDELISEDIITHIQDLSKGFPILISSDQSNKLQLISILLNNMELYNKLYTLFNNENHYTEILKSLQLIENLVKTSKCRFDIDSTCIIDDIASHFSLIQTEQLKKVPKSLLFKIISNEHFQIESNDSLFEIINRIFSNNMDENEKIELIKLYEYLKIAEISNENFQKLLLSIDPNYITVPLWQKLCDRIVIQQVEENPNAKEFLYDGNESHSFEGIIRHLTSECGGNVHDKGIVLITSSSERVWSDQKLFAKYVADLDDNSQTSRLLTENDQESWIQFDFTERKVHPTHYSIRSIPWSKNALHLQSWVIEGSNSVSQNSVNSIYIDFLYICII